MRPERTKVSFDCTQNRFSKVKFLTDGWRGGGEGGFSGRFKCLCYLRGVLKSVSRWLDAGFSDWPSGIPQWSLRDSFIWFCFALALVGIRRTAGRGPSAPDDATAGSIQSTSASSDFLQLGLTSGTWLGFRFLLCYRPGLIPRGRRGEGLDDGGRGGEVAFALIPPPFSSSFSFSDLIGSFLIDWWINGSLAAGPRRMSLLPLLAGGLFANYQPNI